MVFIGQSRQARAIWWCAIARTVLFLVLSALSGTALAIDGAAPKFSVVSNATPVSATGSSTRVATEKSLLPRDATPQSSTEKKEVTKPPASQASKASSSAREVFKMKNDAVQSRFLLLVKGRDKVAQEAVVVKSLLEEGKEKLAKLDAAVGSKKSSGAEDTKTGGTSSILFERVRALQLLLQEKEIEHSEHEKTLLSEFGVVKGRKYQYDPEKKTLYELIQASE